MSDNLHELNDEVQEQDQLVIDVAAVQTTSGNNSTAITTLNNKMAGSISSGLKTLIEGNDTDIGNIQTKTNFISVSQAVNLDTMESNIATNNAKNSYPSGDATKMGHISVSQAVNLDTMESGITTNTNSIDAIELKTDFISCTQNVDLDTMESDIATNNSKVSMVIGTASNQAMAGNTTTISASQATDIANNKTELGNVVMTATNFSNTRIMMGSAASFAEGFGLQNPNYDATFINTKCFIRQDHNGKTFINTPTGQVMSFTINNVEVFNSTQLTNLVDNISVTGAVNLVNNTNNIATNTSDISALTTATNNRFSIIGSATTLGSLAQANEADIVTATNEISTNATAIATNLANINLLLKPMRIHAYAHMISHIGTTAKNAGNNLIDMTTASQRIRWQNIIGSTYLDGIVWTTLGSESNTYFKVPETGLYRVSAHIITMFASAGNERQCTLSFSHYNNSTGTIVNIRETHSSMNRQDNNNFSFSNISMDTPCLLEEGGNNYYFFRVKSLAQGNIRIHSSSTSANSCIIQFLNTDAAGNTFGTGGATSFDLDGSLSFTGV